MILKASYERVFVAWCYRTLFILALVGMVSTTPSCIAYSVAISLFVGLLVASVVLVDLAGNSSSFDDQEFTWGFSLGVVAVVLVFVASKLYFGRVKTSMEKALKAARLKDKSDQWLAEDTIEDYAQEMYRYVPILITVVFLGVLYFFWLIFEAGTWTRYMGLTIIGFTFFLFLYLVMRHLRHTYEIMVSQGEGSQLASAISAKTRLALLLETLSDTRTPRERDDISRLIGKIRQENKSESKRAGVSGVSARAGTFSGRASVANHFQACLDGRRHA